MKMAWINVKADGPSGNGTKITLANGEPIHGIRKAVISLEADKVNKVELEILCERVEVCGDAVFYGFHPYLGGVRKLIKRIEFADGTVFEPAGLA
jgi:hypothetical protein